MVDAVGALGASGTRPNAAAGLSTCSRGPLADRMNAIENNIVAR